ncbi:MAG: hypothetical protein INQ03_14555 [Candidatus Heimdallarchaeota archaeon]|nr:hypothetical protein [Candidatus Heimdallarchaeota archaeon]
MSHNITLNEAEAKLLSSISILFWLIPALFGFQLILNYSSPGNTIQFGGAEVASILKGVLFVIVILRLARLFEDYMSKTREHEIFKLEMEQKERRRQENSIKLN